MGITYPVLVRPTSSCGKTGYWRALLFQIGGAAFGMLVPVLAGYIAYAMADRPGLVPGIVGGLLASAIGAGFLGGLVAGLLAGSSPVDSEVKVPGGARRHAGGGDPARSPR